MRSVSVAEAKAKFSELLNEVESGETVEITRRGKPLAQVVPAPKKLQPIDIEALRQHLASLTSPVQSTEESIREWKDDEKY